MNGAWHFGVLARLGGSDRPDEWRPIKESHGASEAQAAAAFSRYLRTQPERVAVRLRRDAKLEPCTCHPSHVPADIRAELTPD